MLFAGRDGASIPGIKVLLHLKCGEKILFEDITECGIYVHLNMIIRDVAPRHFRGFLRI